MCQCEVKQLQFSMLLIPLMHNIQLKYGEESTEEKFMDGIDIRNDHT